MRIGLYPPQWASNPPLMGGLHRGLLELGHTVCHYEPGQSYDLLLVFNMTSHRTDYEYPPFPPASQPIAFIDAAEYGYFCRLQDRYMDYANSFTERAMMHDTKNFAQQARLRGFLEGRSFPYFLRELHKDVDYPAGYHPIDYPLYHDSVERRPPNRDEYLRRELEVFCVWGMSHPWRVQITEALRGCHRKSEIADRWSEGGNLEPDVYRERIRAARLSVSFDGYGSGSFRMTEVLCRTLLLQCPLSIRTRAPLIDGQTCIAYNVDSRGEEFVGCDIQEKVTEALADPERSFEIYERGFEHCMANLTEKATAAYVIDTFRNHDFRVPTQLAV